MKTRIKQREINRQALAQAVEVNGVWDLGPVLVEGVRHFVWRPYSLRVLGLDLYPYERRFDGYITTAETGEDEEGNTTFSMSVDPSNYSEVPAAWWRRTLYRLVASTLYRLAS